MLFRNYYRCANCGGEWSDVWSAQCDDDCPHCGARHMSPYESEDVEEREAADLLDAGARERAARIRRLNDAFRTTFGGGQVVMTSTVAALPEMVRAHALVAVARFDAFDGSNDPYQEHDFGGFRLCGRTFLFKIDYFDLNVEFGSEDPADSEKTKRVLTLMLAEDS